MLWMTLRILRGQPARLALTVSGISLSVLLMGFLLALYRGVEIGSVSYLRTTSADAWVVQEHTTNILRGFSILTSAHGTLLRELACVESATPVLFRLTSMETPRGPATVYLVGHDPASLTGGPPSISAGRLLRSSGEIVLDEAFAARRRITVGDSVRIQGRGFRVTGLSGGTNMVVIQYAFVSFADVQQLIGISTLVSLYAVRFQPTADRTQALELLRREVPGVSVYSNDEFIANNLREMESGFLPVLFVLAVVGTVALGAVVSLLLTLSVLERRMDLAVLKTLGAPPRALPAMVILQALSLAALSFGVSALLAFPMAETVRWASPEVAAQLDIADVAAVAAGLVVVALASSIVPLRRLRMIYPTEAFA